MKKIINITMTLVAFFLLSTSCVKDLDTIPIDPDEVTADRYSKILLLTNPYWQNFMPGWLFPGSKDLPDNPTSVELMKVLASICVVTGTIRS